MILPAQTRSASPVPTAHPPIPPQADQPSGDLVAIVEGYPGPAIRVPRTGALLTANAAARFLFESQTPWWEQVAEWLRRRPRTSSSLSCVIETARGPSVIEWTAVSLPGGGHLLLGRDATLERRLRHTLTESRQRYRDLVEISSDFAWETGADGRFVFVSPGGALGYTTDSLIGLQARDLCMEAADGLPWPFETRLRVNHVELWLRTASGGAARVVASALPLFGPDSVWIGARGVCRDITDVRAREAELAGLRTRERVLAHIVRALRDEVEPAAALDITAAATARALGAQACRIYRTADDGGFEPVSTFGPDDAVDIAAFADRVRDSEGPLALPADGSNGYLLAARACYRQAINGAVCVRRPADAPPFDAEETQLLAGVADQLGIAHAHIAYQDHLRHLSERDGLTGLLNRRTFLDRLTERLTENEGRTSALLYVDLDNFKAVNDLRGHQRGDAVLKGLAESFRNLVGPTDLVARMGGDEFVLWLEADEAEALALADRLLSEGASWSRFSASADQPLGLSVGVALYRPGRGMTPQALIDRADAAMYGAKGQGKNARALAGDETDWVGARR